MEVMESVIAPATDTLWRVEDPQTDEDWKQLEEAAIATIAAGVLVKRGDASATDDAWATDPAWRELADRMISVAAECRDAARTRDLDALLAAGEVLYPPCAECHMQFHRVATD
jgi:cytochrome c556